MWEDALLGIAVNFMALFIHMSEIAKLVIFAISEESFCLSHIAGNSFHIWSISILIYLIYETKTKEREMLVIEAHHSPPAEWTGGHI